MNVDLSIIIVSWNVRDLLQRCLCSILGPTLQPPPSSLHPPTSNLQPPTSSLQPPTSNLQPPASNLQFELIVVDNASSDGSAEMVRQHFPAVRLIANETNPGFSKGNNQGLARSRGRYVLLLNPDTEVVGQALPTMIAYLDAHPRVGVLGPQLLNPDGSIQSSRRRFPTLATAFLESTILQQWFPDNPAVRRYHVLDRPHDEVQEVDWVVGAAMLVRREAIDQVGLLDEAFFMYSEELDWCYRARQAGWQVVYLPSAQVIHHEGRSSEQVLPRRHLEFQRSKVLFFRKHHGPWQSQVVRLFLLTAYAAQLAEEALKWLLGHKRQLRRERVGAYWQVLKSRLR